MGRSTAARRAWPCLGAALALALAAQPAQAGSWTLTRVTTDTVTDLKPRISGTNLGWSRDGTIVTFDGSTLTPLGAGTGTPLLASPTHIAWNFSVDLFYFDGSTTALVIDDAVYDEDLSLAGSQLAWVLNRSTTDRAVHRYDGGTPQEISLGGVNGEVQASETRVAWVGDPGGSLSLFDRKAYFFDGTSTTQITTSGAATPSAREIQISGSRVVWREFDPSGTDDWDIWFFDGSSTQQLSHNTTRDEMPHVSTSYVVWHSVSGIEFYDGSTTTTLPSTDAVSWRPSVSDSAVIWIQGTGCNLLGDPIDGVCNLFYYDIASQQVTTLKSNARLLRNAHLSERFVVWTEDDVCCTSAPSLFAFDGSDVQQLPGAGDASISGPRIAYARQQASSHEIFVATHESVAPFPALGAQVPALRPLGLALVAAALLAGAACAGRRSRRSVV